jgi:protein-S-isoprenylcysteine O-methyltransferase Ste14
LIDAGLRWLRSTPHRTFIAFPALVLGWEAVCTRSIAPKRPAYLLLLPWGYLQYYFVGEYRRNEHAGSRGFGQLPDRLLTDGPYALTRNPMYLGHLIFLLGLALSWRSKLGLALFALCLPWFHSRVLRDEEWLGAKFGKDYAVYRTRVKRWIPYVL